MSEPVPKFEDLVEADREGRVTWPKCPVCGANIKGYDWQQEMNGQRIVGLGAITSEVCGHTFPAGAADLHWVIHDRKEDGVA